MNLLTSLVRLSGLTGNSTQLRTIKLSAEQQPVNDRLNELKEYDEQRAAGP
jgi:hypothetical protein